MSCTIEEITDEPQPADYDRALGEILVKGHKGNAQEFLVTVFSFLKRQSNFLKDTTEAKKRVLEAYKSVSGEGAFKSGFFGKPASAPAAKAAAQAPPAAAAPSPVTSAPAPTQAEAPTPPEVATSQPAGPANLESPPLSSPAPDTAATDGEVGEASSSGGAEASSSGAAAASGSSSGAAAASGSSAPAEGLPDKEDAEEATEEEKPKGIKPNAARGADFDHYTWGQTLSEVSVSVRVPPGTKAKAMDVAITRNKMRVGIKGQPPILEGEFSEPIKPDETMWNMLDASVEVQLTKSDGMHWWSAVLKGEPAIDTQKVEPENSKLTDLDAETRKTVEKMMFDQRQKALGLPTSEEMQKQEMLKKFMAAHPEMDFSNAKIM